MIERQPTRVVEVGNIGIGGENPIRVQSMITAPTQNIVQAVDQIKELHLKGAEVVRVTTPTIKDAQALAEIKEALRMQYQDVPLVADVHHMGTKTAVEAAKHVEKVRINPGLFVYHRIAGKEEYSDSEINQQLEEIDSALAPVLGACKENGVALRLGVNHGSLSQRLLAMLGDTPEGMVKSALEYIEICQSRGFQDIVISLKSSRVPIMVEANRLMVKRMRKLGMDYPIHLGVTEAGRGETARVKSAAGIGSLLFDGIGDTIRVSLTEDPVNELSIAYDILQASGQRITKGEIIGCPTCGRTKFEMDPVMTEAEQKFGHLPFDTAVMGCIVNGPGEMAGAAYGIVGKGGGKVALYRGREELVIVDQAESMSSLESIMKQDGKWIDPVG